MSREKQIEEMANEINEMDEPNAHYYDNRLQQHEAFADCFTIARYLYGKGYRKQSEGEWISRHHMSRSARGRYTSYYTYICGVCRKANGRRKTPFCPNCGSKMKGGEG